MNNNIPFLSSPHYANRPENRAIDMIIIHAISLPDGQFGTVHIHDLFLGKLNLQVHPSFADLAGVKVSAHFVVARSGEITQFVHTEHRAWHAGASSWLGNDDCNDYSVGIEMVGDERQPFTTQQYTETARLCRVLMLKYPQISKNRIVGHQDVAPTRKWDPGKQWLWQRFFRSLSHIQKLDMAIQ